jgi:arginase
VTIDRRRFMQLSGALLAATTLPAPAAPTLHKIGIVGVPFNSSGLTSGVARAPAVLRAHGLIEQLSKVSDVRDYGDVGFATLQPTRDPISGIKSLQATVSMVPAVEAAVSRVLADDRFPLILGGDCPVMLGGLAAVHNRSGRVGLMFVDGHEDAYPPHSSPTGEAADMEFAFAIGLYLEDAPRDFASRFPLVQPTDTVIIGARDSADLKHDKVVSLASKVRVISSVEAQTRNGAVLAREELARLEAIGVSGVWLHTDLDVLSSEALAAVDYRQPGGFSWDRLTGMVQAVIRGPSTVGWDVTIYNPDLDPHQAHANTIVKFIVAAFSA